jgi:hypothetical protein
MPSSRASNQSVAKTSSTSGTTITVASPRDERQVSRELKKSSVITSLERKKNKETWDSVLSQKLVGYQITLTLLSTLITQVMSLNRKIVFPVPMLTTILDIQKSALAGI